jgi:Protein of unknown function (DUF550)
VALARQGDVMNHGFDFTEFLHRKIEWSRRTFGPDQRTHGLSDHIRKELEEIEQNPADLEEWIDIILLAIDGAWRSGASPEDIVAMLMAKAQRNELRSWPDWRRLTENDPIEHIRESDVSQHDLFDGLP